MEFSGREMGPEESIQLSVGGVAVSQGQCCHAANTTGAMRKFPRNG